jgi:hypothetical protein
MRFVLILLLSAAVAWASPIIPSQIQLTPQIVTIDFTVTIDFGLEIGPPLVPPEPAAAVTETDCSALAAEVWQAAGYSEPFEKTAAETQEGDGCILWAPGPKKRQ